MTTTGQFRPSRPRGGRRPVLFVALPGVQLLDVIGPLEAFDAANRILERRRRPAFYDLALTSPASRTTTGAGLVVATVPLARARAPHTLVIGGHLTMGETPTPSRDLASIRRLARGAERVVSVCTGAFVLGELGYLDGRRCTTHWLALDALRRRWPGALVEDDAIYVDAHPVYSSAGVTCGLDLALHLIEGDLGGELALTVARVLVMFLHRPGGQSQFSASMRLRSGADQRLKRLIAEIVERPAGAHDVDALARRVGMSTRNFARVFRREAGQTPAAFVEQARLDAARGALELTDQTVAAIAAGCGFGTEETLRRVFQRTLGVGPADYRRRFHRRRA